MTNERCYHWSAPGEPTLKTQKAFGDFCPYCEIEWLQTLIRGMIVECDEDQPGKAAWLARRTGKFGDPPADEPVDRKADEIERLRDGVERLAQYCGNRGAAVQSVAHMARELLNGERAQSEPGEKS